MKHIILLCSLLHVPCSLLHATPVVHEVTVYPFAATITHQADLVIEEYVPLDAKRPGKRWTFKNPNVSKRTVWRVTAEPNTVFNAFLDTDGNGKYDVGEPFGTSAGRDYPEIELTDISPITPRIDLVSQKSDRSLTWERIETNIIERIKKDYGESSIEFKELEWIYNNHIETTDIRLCKQRLRVVRWLLSGSIRYGRPAFLSVNTRVILDKTLETDVRTVLTEADFLVGEENVFDLEWNDLYTEVINRPGVIRDLGNVTNICYLIVVGDGPVDWRTTTSSNYTVKALGPVIERNFGFYRQKPETQSPIVRNKNVTLSWRMDVPEIDGYTAYRAKILSGTTEVNDTGLFRNPARWDDGSFHWTITNSIPPGTYNWKIAAYNSKYSNEQASAYTNGVPFTVTGE